MAMAETELLVEALETYAGQLAQALTAVRALARAGVVSYPPDRATEDEMQLPEPVDLVRLLELFSSEQLGDELCRRLMSHRSEACGTEASPSEKSSGDPDP